MSPPAAASKAMFKFGSLAFTRDAAPLLGVTLAGCTYGIYVMFTCVHAVEDHGSNECYEGDSILGDWDTSDSEKDTMFSYIGIAVVAYYASLIVTFAYDVFVRPGVKLSKFGAGQGFWAIVTGCTDGLGRETALELARKGFNILLVSRSQDKLDLMATEVRALGVEARVLAVDFAKVSVEQWAEIQRQVDDVRVGVLVNNVGVSYDYPMFLEEVSEETVDALVDINMRAMVKMTRTVLPQMKERKSGLILNNGSFAALLPSPFLSVYSGSKGFVKYFSQSVASEVAKDGIIVEHLQTYFVCSKMSKTKKPNFFIPLPKPYIKTVLNKIGVQGGSSEPYTSVPFFSHALMAFLAERLVPKQAAIDYNFNLLNGLRKRALKKIQREQEADKAKTA
ncbi:hypothetical protein LPJ66_008551 [Kickxella alabastrina]|uniref:Uncharacterized protein n=1 Tax=Kickxella alabastrina TaxID=61397 RepID=A0ACC1IDY3_9FUNG|nr:hypothetical protein LPJ66_008551 [Kickxella alabastrina]